jgi:predicted Ser/Thr protein kinase
MPDGHPLLPGDPAELGGNRLLRRLGEGSQGVVYLGRNSSGEHVAIKLLHARMAEDRGARERFMRELSAAKKVARFCTAQVLDADVAGDHPYIVSEYVEGRSLRSHITAEGPRTGGTLERLAIGTLTALAAIHKAGIVHRDFTPHNVLLGPDGPRVIDFGIARALGAARNEDTGSVGTPAYMSPEQVSSREVGAPADMFAWGSTIVFAGTGHPPFGNESVHAVMERIVAAEPDVSALPEPLRSVVTACLSKDPAQRPSAQQAQASLLGHEATEALMPPPAFGAPPADQASADDGRPGPQDPVAPTAGSTAVENPAHEADGRRRVLRASVENDPSATTTARPTAAGPAGAPPATRPPSAPAPAAQSPAPQDQGAHERPAQKPTGQRRVVHAPAGSGPSAPAGRAPSAEVPVGDRPGARAAAHPAARADRSPTGSVLTPAPASTGGRRRPRVGWAILAGAAVVVVGAVVAVPLWPDGGDAARAAPQVRAAAAPTTPAPSPSVTPGPHLNGIRSGAAKPAGHKKHAKHPAKGCRDYQRAYSVGGAGSVLLKVSVCRGAYTGDVVLADAAPKDGWDVCLQLRGHVTGPGAVYVSTTLTSRDGGMQSFDNGPKARYGARTTRTEDQVVVNAGRCKGSGARIQTAWQTQDQLASG